MGFENVGRQSGDTKNLQELNSSYSKTEEMRKTGQR